MISPSFAVAIYVSVGQHLWPRYKPLTLSGFPSSVSSPSPTSVFTHPLTFVHLHTLVLKITMLSFSKVITFAAVAFGTLSQAVPLTPREVGIGARASGPVQLKGLLTDLKTRLVVAVAPISMLV